MTVSDQIIQVLDALCEKFGLAFDWTSDNVIPYITTLCGKLISYEIWTSVAWMVVMSILSVASIVAAKKLYPFFKRKIENQGRYDCGWSIGATWCVIGLVVFNTVAIINFIGQIFDIITCVTFPEMFVIEYVQDLIEAASR